MWTPANSNGHEARKILWELVPYTRGKGLDVGCGPSKPFPHFIGIDSNFDAITGNGPEASARNLIGDGTDLSLFSDESMDFVFSSHFLEHVQDYRAALAEWWRVIKPGGHLCLYLPHKDLYPNIGTPGANPDHRHDFMPSDIVEAMKKVAPCFDIVRNEDRNEEDEYSFFQVYKKLPGGWKADRQKQDRRESYKAPKPAKTCAIMRYGAYGDVLQTASIVPGLKEQGYHVTWYCTPRGYESIKTDPRLVRLEQARAAHALRSQLRRDAAHHGGRLFQREPRSEVLPDGRGARVGAQDARRLPRPGRGVGHVRLRRA